MWGDRSRDILKARTTRNLKKDSDDIEFPSDKFVRNLWQEDRTREKEDSLSEYYPEKHEHRSDESESGSYSELNSNVSPKNQRFVW